MFHISKWTSSLVVAGLLAATSAAAQPAQAPTLLFSYEAMAFGLLGLDGEKATYDQRDAFTREVADRELPQILEVLEIPASEIETEVTPGGYLLQTNASLQSSFEADAATADRFAAAVGYVFRQWSVLVTDFTPAGEGDTGYAVVTFADHPPSGDEAQAFFEHAASVNEGLGGGYTAFGHDLYFLNVTDGEGNPYSGLDDETFVADLTRAAESYTGQEAVVSRSGRADARFVGNDWEASPDGEDYAGTCPSPSCLDAEMLSALGALREAHEANLRAAAEQHGWQ
ncbi:MAG: hypothetical protein ACFCVH_17340 [Alphaproteobacteria bacterium]